MSGHSSAVATLGARLTLSTAEMDFLDRAGVRSPEAAHSLLVAMQSAPDDPAVRPGAARCGEIAGQLDPLLCDAYRQELREQATNPLIRGTGAIRGVSLLGQANFLIAPSAPKSAPSRLHDQPDVDLLTLWQGPDGYRKWSAVDQGDRNTCIAYAVASCMELALSRSLPDFIELSPQFLYWHMRRRNWDSPPPGWETGATKLGHAKEVLSKEGICHASLCPTPTAPTTPLEGDGPSDPAMLDAAGRRADKEIYIDYPTPTDREPGLARKVYEELAAGRPVAIAVPVGEVGRSTNWMNFDTSRTGVVLNPAGWTVSENGLGHAVCVFAFQKDQHDPNGGWFIFRNSHGQRWAKHAPSAAHPLVAHPGFGAISASYIEDHCWEVLSLKL